MERSVLGRSGIVVSRLGFGTGTDGWGGSSQQSRLGVKGLSRLLRYAYDRGVASWDSADQYGTHPHLREALKGLKRDSVVVSTKTNARTKGEAERAVSRFLRELGTDYIDIVLIHYVHSSDWPSQYSGAMEALQGFKDKGAVRAVGISCHDLSALRAAAENPWLDVILARINYAGVNMDGSPERVAPILERLRAAGKGVYAMKVLGKGHLVRDLEWAFRYVFGIPAVGAAVVGMASEREVDENIAAVTSLERAAQIHSH
ncbi:MAG: aldo/keto reductase [bacterium]